MKYNAIDEERKWWNRPKSGKRKSKPFPPRHYFAHSCLHSSLHETLVALRCGDASSILDVGCGTGKDVVLKLSRNIVGVDVSCTALRSYIAKGYQGILADAKMLPFHINSFQYVMSADLLHHLVGQGDLLAYVREFVRVLRGGLRGCIRACLLSSLWNSHEYL